MTDDTPFPSLTHLQQQQYQQQQPHLPSQEYEIKQHQADHPSLFPLRGYIAMIVVDELYRRTGIVSSLVRRFIEETTRMGAHEIALETEVSNRASLCLYRQLGFAEKNVFFVITLMEIMHFDYVTILDPFPFLSILVLVDTRILPFRWMLNIFLLFFDPHYGFL
jgi:hypothetical protein